MTAHSFTALEKSMTRRIATAEKSMPKIETTSRLLSIIVPAFNEAGGIGQTLRQIRDVIEREKIDAEIVVVDDGSADDTADIAEREGVTVIRKGRNVGYGHSLKMGILATESEYVAIIDADGTYPADQLPQMLRMCATSDMIVGNRGLAMKGVPLVRRPAKWVLNQLTNALARNPIPDVNSGLRMFRRSSLERFLQLLPDGFSFTTTITMCMFSSGLSVVYHPIKYGVRVGKSKIRPTDFFRFVMLVLRIVVLFNPLRIFMPVGLALFMLGAAKAVYDVFIGNLSESAIFGMLAALIIWSMGLIADMISRLHLRP